MDISIPSFTGTFHNPILISLSKALYQESFDKKNKKQKKYPMGFLFENERFLA